MFGLGFSEIVVLAVLGLILLGPEQLPEMARTLGRFLNDLKRSTDDLSQEFKNQGFNSRQLLEDIRKETAIETKPVEASAETKAEIKSENTAVKKEEFDEHGKKPESN